MCTICLTGKEPDHFPETTSRMPKRVCLECKNWKTQQHYLAAQYRRTGALPASDHEPRDLTHYLPMLEQAAAAFLTDIEYLIRMAKDATS